jgi:hypothetical protein
MDPIYPASVLTLDDVALDAHHLEAGMVQQRTELARRVLANVPHVADAVELLVLQDRIVGEPSTEDEASDVAR